MSELALFGGEPALREPVTMTWPLISDADVARVADAARRGEISYDASEGLVAELEAAFEARLGRPYALATSSGTAALHSAFFGLGLGRGDEVLAPTYTYLATVMPIVACNATPVLVDAEPDTGNIDLDDAERHVTARTRAMVVTHLSGHPVDMERATRFARRHDLKVVEDCSQAHGAASAGRRSAPVATSRRSAFRAASWSPRARAEYSPPLTPTCTNVPSCSAISPPGRSRRCARRGGCPSRSSATASTTGCIRSVRRSHSARWSGSMSISTGARPRSPPTTGCCARRPASPRRRARPMSHATPATAISRCTTRRNGAVCPARCSSRRCGQRGPRHCAVVAAVAPRGVLHPRGDGHRNVRRRPGPPSLPCW
ncbi:aminotransferase class I/II-fold pyridoxal phosphate-dependent enzyme [Streptomyces sp. M19]